MPGTRVPCAPPPPGKTYEEQKVNLARREAEEEARRTGERIGRAWGETLGKADEARNTLNFSLGGGRPFDVALWNNPGGAEAMRADLARRLNAIPDLPTYDDEGLAKIAWEAFLKGYGKGWADAEAKFAIVNALADTLLTLATAGAGALETAGARALRSAQQRLRSMPVFLPSAAGGPGGFLRRPKLPSAPAPSPPPAAQPKPPSGTTVTTTTKPVSSPNGGAGQAGGKARLPPKGTPERRAIETARDKGVRLKKAQELENIREGGRGSGVWSDKELDDIRKTGEFPLDARWHHDPTVANRPDLAADPSVVRPVRGGTQGHLKAHGGDFRKP
ncbi:hypothetical protein [Polyangium sp. 15x6]|uniref:hypothetical protein n=1 Tax=Polyangium sp. 15x6 TaxID=3042687 RepID=UPI00249BF928|nr:hypothetical protein [Polyangium sp. 15x6]MDI3287271.1 hypothetical protein [Polyangium sp. 15x6]